MTEPNALDYSWSRPDPAAMAKAGILAVARYLTGQGKALTRAEVDALHAAGIGVVLNYEMTASAALGGEATGEQARGAAVAAAKALGAPAGTPIYYSVDTDVSAAQMPAVLAYLRACDDPTYPARCYGEADVLDAFARPGWQTLAWSGGRLSGHAVLYQYAINETFGGAAVDHDRILDPAALGAWWPPDSPYGDDMPTADEIAQAVWGYKLTLTQAAPLKPVTAPASAFQVNASDYAHDAKYATAALISQVAGLKAALAAVAANQNATADEITAAAQKGAQQALDAYQLTITPKEA